MKCVNTRRLSNLVLSVHKETFHFGIHQHSGFESTLNRRKARVCVAWTVMQWHSTINSLSRDVKMATRPFTGARRTQSQQNESIRSRRIGALWLGKKMNESAFGSEGGWPFLRDVRDEPGFAFIPSVSVMSDEMCFKSSVIWVRCQTWFFTFSVGWCRGTAQYRPGIVAQYLKTQVPQLPSLPPQ